MKMPRLLALLVAVLGAVVVAACERQPPAAAPPPAAQTPPRPFQEEPPIKVRSGSTNVLTQEGTEWEAEGSGSNAQWTQNKENGGGAGDDLFLKVQYEGGTPTCTGEGKTINIERNGVVIATFKRAGKKVKLTPKNSFERHNTNKRLVINSSAGEITKVVAKKNTGDTECPGPMSVHDVICIASLQAMACNK